MFRGVRVKMGGGTFKIPHWQSPQYTVGEHTPELQEIEKRLAARGLKDPWLRNEAWRYARGGAHRYNPFWMTYNFIRPRAFLLAVPLALITSQVWYIFYSHRC